MVANAKTCPNCGAPNKSIRSKNKMLFRNILVVAAIIVAVVAIMIGVTSCKPKLDRRVYDYGIESLKAVDDYLDGKISGTVAVNRLEENYNKLEQLGELADADSLGLRTDALLIRASISSVKYEITIYKKGADTTSADIIKARNSLADKLNKKHR